MLIPLRSILAALAAASLEPAFAQQQLAELDPPQGAAIGLDSGQAFLIAGGGVMAGAGQAAVQPSDSLPRPDSGGGVYGGAGFRPFRVPPSARGTAPAPSPAPAPAPPADGGTNLGLVAVVVAHSERAGHQINSTGGYRFDGYNDCYGFVRRVWDPILKGLQREALPVNDHGNPDWKRVEDWKELRRGDVLATHQGHKWGKGWHGGLFWGVAPNGAPIVKDSHPRNAVATPGSNGGVAVRVYTNFAYYYAPTHALLTAAEPRRGSAGRRRE